MEVDPNVERVPLSVLKRRRGELRLRACRALEALELRVEGLRCVDVSSIELWEIASLEIELQAVDARCEAYGDAHIEVQCVAEVVLVEDETSEDDRVICEFQTGLLSLEHEIQTLRCRREALVLSPTPFRVMIAPTNQLDESDSRSLLAKIAPFCAAEPTSKLMEVGGAIVSLSQDEFSRCCADEFSRCCSDEVTLELVGQCVTKDRLVGRESPKIRWWIVSRPRSHGGLFVGPENVMVGSSNFLHE